MIVIKENEPVLFYYFACLQEYVTIMMLNTQIQLVPDNPKSLENGLNYRGFILLLLICFFIN
jgi:hypothetical protein